MAVRAPTRDLSKSFRNHSAVKRALFRQVDRRAEIRAVRLKIFLHFLLVLAQRVRTPYRTMQTCQTFCPPALPSGPTRRSGVSHQIWSAWPAAPERFSRSPPVRRAWRGWNPAVQHGSLLRSGASLHRGPRRPRGPLAPPSSAGRAASRTTLPPAILGRSRAASEAVGSPAQTAAWAWKRRWARPVPPPSRCRRRRHRPRRPGWSALLGARGEEKGVKVLKSV